MDRKDRIISEMLEALEIVAGMCCIEHAQAQARAAIAKARGEN